MASLTARATKQFKRDIQGYAGNLDRLLAITAAMHTLLKGERLPSALKPHKLQGEYKDHWECHIENDLLLIWLPDPKRGEVTFVRLGTHSELFE